MWQRVQTIFLALVVVTMVATIFFPIWVYQPGTENAHTLYPLHYTVKQEGVITTQYFPYSLTAIFSIASATLAFVSSGKFRNRLLQRKLGALNSLFMAATVGSSFYFANQLMHAHEIEGQHYSLGLYLPVIAVVSNFLANRFIMRDEKIVRDSDRLR
jgi:hypothetical protein